MRYFLTALLALMFVSVTAAEGMKTTLRVGLDPILRGVWVVHGDSADEGKTVNSYDKPIELAQATASRIVFNDGSQAAVTQVMVIEFPGKAPMNMATLENGNVLVFSKQLGQPFFLLQLMKQDGEGNTYEEARFVLEVR